MASLMHGELVIVGDEVLDGRVLNTNAAYLSSRLAGAGLAVRQIVTVGDQAENLAEALGQAVQRANFVLVTGGLGPTTDDKTTATAAEVFNSPLTLRTDILEHIRDVCRQRGRSVGELEKLAWLPQEAEPLHPKSQFCGFFLVQGRVPVIFLPGVPAEVRALFDGAVMPLLLAQFPERPVFRQQRLKLFGPTESELAGWLKEIILRHPAVIFGSYPCFPEVHLSLSVKTASLEEAQALLSAAEADILVRAGRFVFGREDETLESILGRLCLERGLTLATAESCTGGQVAERITAVPGASNYFIQGVIAYANRAKEALLGVSPALLSNYGAVSPQTAAAMAEGLKLRAEVDLALSVTGIAGPQGGTLEKPVGTVFFSLAGFGRTVVERRLFSGRREQIQALAAAQALDLARRLIVEATA